MATVSPAWEPAADANLSAADPRTPAVADARWIREAVLYQIFVDRFANGDHRIDPPDVAAWGAMPTPHGYMGGDLEGIIDRLDHVAALGANVVCLTPIFLSASNHRYDTYDYYRIDPRAGSLRALRRLVRAAHRRGIRIVLDGVFNHCGRGFYPFFDVMENGAASSYRDWFYVDGFPVEAYGRHRFKAWQDTAALPELNLGNEETRDYLLRVAAFWTRQGIDGWRLDAVRHARHRQFWSHLRRTVKRVNPAAYLLAEIWDDASAWLAAGDFDGATNYPFRELAIRFLIERSMRASDFSRALEALLTRERWATNLGMCNLIGSHDTPRIWTLAGGDVAGIKLAFLLQFAFPGVPALYYGDEIGLEGGPDPDNRRAMQWDPRRWNVDLCPFVKRLSEIRRSAAPLQHGDWRTLVADDRSALCVFARRSDRGCAILALHNGDRDVSPAIDIASLGVPDATHFVDGLSGRTVVAERNIVKLRALAPRSGALLIGTAFPAPGVARS
jgi:glycosidase